MNKALGYEGKLFSILGDSVSTLDGYSEPCDAAFYVGEKKLEAEVFTPEDTWWGQVIESLGGSLLVNNSHSGSMVCKHPKCEIPSYSCSDERTSALHKGENVPDVILIFMGTNDWGCGIRIIPRDSSEDKDLSIFSVAYNCMIEKLKNNYPKAEIWCMTLPISTCKCNEMFAFPFRYAGRYIEDYCDIIRSCAEENSCRLIDIYKLDSPHDTIDGFHPNREGMKVLAESVIACLLE